MAEEHELRLRLRYMSCGCGIGGACRVDRPGSTTRPALPAPAPPAGPQGHLASMAAARKLDAAAAGEAIARLPPLQLLQPSKVLAEQVVAVRRDRQQGGSKALQAVQVASGNLSERDIEMLRHSYTLMAAGGAGVGCLGLRWHWMDWEGGDSAPTP